MNNTAHTAKKDRSAFRAMTDLAALTRALATAGLAFDTSSGRAVCLECRDGDLLVSTASRDTRITVRLPGAGTAEQRDRIIVDHTELGRLLTAFAKGRRRRDAEALPVTVRATDPDSPVVDSAGYTVPLAPRQATDSPDLLTTPPTVAQVDRATFVTELARVRRAADTGTATVPALAGVLLDIGTGSVTLAGTDRYRLAVAQVPAVSAATFTPDSAVLPGRQLPAITKSWQGQHVKIGLHRRGPLPVLSLTCGHITIVTHVTSDRFPDYHRVLLNETTGTIVTNRAALLEHAQRAAAILVAKRCASPVAMTVTPATVSITPVLAGSTDAITSPATPARTDGVTKPITVSLNPSYLLDAVASFTGTTIAIHLTGGQLRPVLFTDTPDGPRNDAAFRHLVMPMRAPA